MNYFDIKITGKDIKRFLTNLHKMHIEFYHVEYGDHSATIKVKKTDYDKLIKIKTIYKIEVVKCYGVAAFIQFIRKYFIFFIMLAVGFLFFIGLTNVIFEVEVVHNNKELRELVLNELASNGISKYHLVVSYERKEEIKANILKKYKDRLEWLEIERQGTKYQISLEERKLKLEDSTDTAQHIVAKKDGLIKRILATDGEIVAKKDQYVKKGDIIISGIIHNKENVVDITRANGSIYAETWYTVTVLLPYHYREEAKTGNNQHYLAIRWFNNSLKWFRFKNYQDSNLDRVFEVKNNILPISISIVKESELDVVDKVYTKDNSESEASLIARDRLKQKLGDKIEILYEKKLKIEEEDSKIKVVMFYKVYEDITDYQSIIPDNLDNDDNEEIR